MKIVHANPRKLRDNPENPRRTRPSAEADAQLLANIQAVGILQPPTAREIAGELVLIAGHRRRDAAIKAKLKEIAVLVREPGDDAAQGGDGVRALAENMVRTAMSPVDQWRAVEALVGEDWTEDAIAAALNLPVRRIRALRHLARVHPAMLDHMARGDMPTDQQLRTIGLASAEEQASVWQKNKPKRGERAHWHGIAAALEKRRIPFGTARFGEAETEAFGIVWQDDLFVPAGQEGRFTTQLDAFLQAQQAWLEANLPDRAVLLGLDEWGRVMIPKGAQELYYQQPRDERDRIGLTVDPRSGEVRQTLFREAQPREERGGRGREASADSTVLPKLARPPLSQKGDAMVGDLRTEALHEAFAQAEIPDQALIGLLVLALAGQNVQVRSGAKGDDLYAGARAAIAAGLLDGGVLTADADALRAAARAMLRQALSCRVGFSTSGLVARYAGVAVDADAYLPTTATEEFLAHLSKDAIMGTASANNVAPRNTGKATRAAVVERFKGQTFLHPLVRFALTTEEQRKLAEQRQREESRAALRASWQSSGEDDGEDPGKEMDGEEGDGSGEEEAAGDIGMDGEEVDLPTDNLQLPPGSQPPDVHTT
ncbi:MAG: hypothetical protein DI601_26325 [Azospirillum brasilense]|uniref:ParB N-terminal domain-containing protein n=1 Tax=Roseomonas mucosa TaxID=207340 RepID=UPI000DB537DF|nr:ParB N-terminal domain-containing protein [Roseomonas mucosa]PZP38579.1 MAG: hypothetical protein DI601_26325 [Azospirillum brasilense]QDD96981.1 Nuclease, ParB family [Roseomonas mucosa]